MPQTKLHTAARTLKAVTSALLRPAEALQKKLKCCATGSASANSNDAEVVSSLQPTANAATATAVTHIFPKPACLKVLPQSTQISPRKTALSKLSGLWSCITDPTGFDSGADKLKAQRRAARLSRARKRSSFAESDPESPRIAAVHSGGLSSMADMNMLHLQCWVQQGVQGTANGISMQDSAVLADVYSRLRQIDRWLSAQLKSTLSPYGQMTSLLPQNHSIPFEGYHEPFYDDSDMPDIWGSECDTDTSSVEGDPGIMFSQTQLQEAAQKLAETALEAAISGAIADVIQAADALTLIA